MNVPTVKVTETCRGDFIATLRQAPRYLQPMNMDFTLGWDQAVSPFSSSLRAYAQIADWVAPCNRLWYQKVLDSSGATYWKIST